jgi:hypothetical protein
MRQARVAAIAIAMLLGSTGAWAQDAKSTAGARELADLLAQKKLDAIAARDPVAPDAFVAALHFPGQLMVISARYSAPALLNERLVKKQYRDVYIELNAASAVESRVFVTDIGADGLQVRPAKRDGPIDMRDAAGKAFRFDGNWREDKMSEADYMKLHTEADELYAKAVALLATEAKK